MKSDRYQHQSWYIKIWRRRYYFKIPFAALKMWLKSNEKFKFCWRLAVGCAQADMKWYYTMEEVFERLDKKIS